MIYVIGSGPAGVAASQALLRQGLEVTMLDAGLELEPDHEAAVKAMRSVSPTDWHGAHMRLMTGRNDATHKGIPKKLVYGSDYPYRDVGRFIKTTSNNADMSASLALGGLSNVWGSAVAPYTAQDIAAWPIGVEALAPHYRALFEWMPLSAWEDDLKPLLPLYTDRHRPLRMSRQATGLLHDLNTSRARLNSDGIQFGAARIAVRANEQGGQPGCAYCRLCLHGCPYGLIYSSAFTVREMVKNPLFHYHPNVVVNRLREEGGTVRIDAVSFDKSEPVSFTAERVYLAAGTLSSTKIILDSLDAHEKPVRFLDSQYFLLPLIRFARTAGVTHEKLHTLVQLFMEINDPTVSANLVHLQIYSYNELFLRAMQNMFGPFRSLMSIPVNQMVGRMLLCQGFLHSDCSKRVRATLSKPGPDGRTTLHLEGEAGIYDPQATVDKVIRKLRRHMWAMKMVPASPMLHMASPGRSFHVGGSLPMSAEPKEFQSDVLGRPKGFGRVHVVDASVLPSIAATTITLTVMANAHRIASAHAQV
ncbi:MAG: hypothetical protein K8S99_06275 [Planctomycetes bacterium]|nr:hypothetical protein [Planctomycetota bacterium]